MDPVQVDPTGHTAIDFFVPSLDGRYVAVSLSRGGSESGDIHVDETANGKPLVDVVTRVNGGAFSDRHAIGDLKPCPRPVSRGASLSVLVPARRAHDLAPSHSVHGQVGRLAFHVLCLRQITTVFSFRRQPGPRAAKKNPGLRNPEVLFDRLDGGVLCK